MTLKGPEDDVRRGDGWHGWIGYHTPVIGEGVVNGCKWSFYARGDVWALNIAGRPGDDPDSVGITVAGWSAQGQTPTRNGAGWMEPDEAWRHVASAFEKLRRGELRWVEPGTPGF